MPRRRLAMDDDHLIFSRRYKLSKVTEEWCLAKGVPACSMNIITALESMDLLDRDRVREDEYCSVGDDNFIYFFKKDGSEA
jgi:hypothetical protein